MRDFWSHYSRLEGGGWVERGQGLTCVLLLESLCRRMFWRPELQLWEDWEEKGAGGSSGEAASRLRVPALSSGWRARLGISKCGLISIPDMSKSPPRASASYLSNKSGWGGSPLIPRAPLEAIQTTGPPAPTCNQRPPLLNALHLRLWTQRTGCINAHFLLLPCIHAFCPITSSLCLLWSKARPCDLLQPMGC